MPKNKKKKVALGVQMPEPLPATHVPIEDFKEVNELWDKDRLGRLAAETQLRETRDQLLKKETENAVLREQALLNRNKESKIQPVATILIDRLHQIEGLLQESAISDKNVAQAVILCQHFRKDAETNDLGRRAQILYVIQECVKLRKQGIDSSVSESLLWHLATGVF